MTEVSPLSGRRMGRRGETPSPPIATAGSINYYDYDGHSRVDDNANVDGSGREGQAE